MTERKIAYALSRIQSSKENGCTLEALIKSYYLNLDVILFILSSSVKGYSAKDKKLKAIVKDLSEEISANPGLKSILNKKNIKPLKPWMEKMDAFFRALRVHAPSNIKALQSETEKIFAILNISANKLFVKNKA